MKVAARRVRRRMVRVWVLIMAVGGEVGEVGGGDR